MKKAIWRFLALAATVAVFVFALPMLIAADMVRR